MRKDMLGKAGLAAVILLAPGGFILGATLLARHYRQRRAQGEQQAGDEAPPSPTE